jgi:hypothetical protein
MYDLFVQILSEIGLCEGVSDERWQTSIARKFKAQWRTGLSGVD